MTQKELGERLLRLRKMLGLSQQDFASKCGLETSYYGNLEKGNKNPTLRILDRTATGLGITISDLLGGEDPIINEYDEGMNQAIIQLAKLSPDVRKDFVAVIKVFAKHQ